MPTKDKPDEQKTERFNMFMSPSEMRAIDEWAWAVRVRSKSEAVRRLVQIGLRVERGTLQLNRTGEELSKALAELDLAIAKAISTNEGVDKAEAINRSAQELAPLYMRQQRAAEAFMDAVAGIQLQQIDFRRERNFPKAMKKADETYRLFSEPLDDEDEQK